MIKALHLDQPNPPGQLSYFALILRAAVTLTNPTINVVYIFLLGNFLPHQLNGLIYRNVASQICGLLKTWDVVYLAHSPSAFKMLVLAEDRQSSLPSRELLGFWKDSFCTSLESKTFYQI